MSQNPLIKNIFNEITISREYSLNLKDQHIKNDFGEYLIKVEKNKNKIIIKRQVRITPQVIDIDNYKNFLKFCKEVDNIEKEELY